MLSSRRTRREQESDLSKSRLACENWVRLEGTGSSPYGSLICFDSADRTTPSPTPREPEYLIKVGRKIFKGNDHKKLVRLAVAARRKSHSA